MKAKETEGLRLLYLHAMDPTVIAAIIGAASAILINIATNAILNARQTAVLELRIKQLENSLDRITGLPDRVTRLETQMTAVNDAIREMRMG